MQQFSIFSRSSFKFQAHTGKKKKVKFSVSQGNAWKEWPEIWHAAVSWPPSEQTKFWSQSVDFPIFCPLFGFVPMWLAFGGWGMLQLLDT